MPGIAGYISSAPTACAPGLLGQMLETMRHAAWYRSEAAGDPATGLALGRVSLGIVNTAAQPAELGSSRIVMDGEIYAASARAGDPASIGEDHARQLLRGYLAEGESYFAQVEGRFSAALWDADRGKLLLVSDKFGAKPLYYALTSEGLIFASEIKAILAHPAGPRHLNLRGAAQLFTFGHLWNEDTLYDEIHCLPPGSCVAYEPRTEKLCATSYWRLQPAAGSLTAHAALDQLDERLAEAVRIRTSDDDGLGVALSGGLDARTLLALTDPDRVHPTCVCCGIEGSLDQRTARQLASLAGCDYRAIALDQNFLADFPAHLARMVELTDGQYLSQCIVMPTLPLYRQWGVTKLLRGHAGELLHMHKAYNFSLDRRVAASLSAAGLEDWMFGRLKSFMVEGVATPLLRQFFNADMSAIARDSLRAALDRTNAWSHPVDRVSQLFLDQRTRRETAVSLAKFNSVVEPRVPFLDGPFMEAVFATPWQLRIGEEIQAEILRRRRPEFLKPLNANTGAPVGVSAARRALGYYRMKVLAKLGVRGYQPYERIGLWLRNELQPLVKSILLDPRCLDRGVLDPITVRTIVQQHAEGKNHTYLILAMMIFESGMRRCIDSESMSPSQYCLS